MIGESVLILAPRLGILPSWIPEGLVNATSNLQVRPIFLWSSLLVCTGGWIRYQCFRALGRLFTFELAVRKDHKLVTKGPYSIVRHPSYTGTVILGAGMVLLFVDEFYGAKSKVVSGLIAFSCVMYASFCFGLYRRTSLEDAMMKKEFGKQWEDWASKVRYKLVPYVF